MPKEILHWIAVTRTAHELGETRIGRAAREHSDVACLGALFPDVFYFADQRGPDGTRFGDLADRMHGTRGEDTFEVLRAILPQADSGSRTGESLAFLCGVASHIFVDAEFHPFVYHQTGSIYWEDPGRRSLAVQRHRRLETMIDLYFSERRANGCEDWDPAGMWRCSRAAVVELADETMRRLLGVPGGYGDSVARVYSRLVAVHRISRVGFVAFLAHAGRRLWPRPLRELSALFYSPQLRGRSRKLAGQQQMRHPVTGERRSVTLDGMLNSGIERAVSLCRLVSDAVDTGAGLPAGLHGPSLELGHRGMPARDMRVFASPPPLWVD